MAHLYNTWNRCVFAASLAILISPYARAGVDEDALSSAYGGEDFITIATGKRQPLSQAPAVASVITAEDIKNIGATDLDQILETVPGLHVSVAPRGYAPIYTMRGIYSENNPQILVLINDIPITNLYVGNRNDVWGGMPVNDISRIEIMRGPGSALYGADSFAGTINIITKTADEINGTEVGDGIGSFGTREAYLLHGGNWMGTDVALYLDVLRTEGQRNTIEADAQTGFDSLFNTNASLAPGSLNLGRDVIESRIDLSRGNLRFRAGYQGRRHVGTGAGVALALDPEGEAESDRVNADLTYDTTVAQFWDITAQASYLYASAEPDLILYPPGAFGGAFPDGMIGRPYVYERHFSGGLSAFYRGFENHSIRLGAGTIFGDLYKIKEQKNYAPDGSPLGEIVDVSDDPSSVFLEPHSRTIAYTFVQDEWTMAPDWRLTGGVRYDHYSDFGDTTNPRLALVWQTSYDLTTKFLYGRAFRAPAFNELYNINNPVALGNPNLKPETIDTFELAFNYQTSQKLQTSLNLFSYEMKDVIRFTPPTFTAENAGEIKGHGLELEAKYDVTPSLKFLMNYALQKSQDDDTNTDIANAPEHQIYARGTWAFAPDWSASAESKWVAGRKRDADDTRDTVDDYLITDLILRYITGPWEIDMSVRNIFNADAREPSPRLLPNGTAMIPNDLPLPDRNYFIEAQYRFQ